ncbi:hypothetical protein GCM10023191_044730 [Actinoallomurus oryzae]|uniref:Uncharacterized protein n=1 Tax=Actinoallomurus oryzae TaxID=502180 RepID=A0ABP8Q7U9_9ACTN
MAQGGPTPPFLEVANAVIMLETLTKMILSALAVKIAEGGQDALPAEQANLTC